MADCTHTISICQLALNHEMGMELTTEQMSHCLPSLSLIYLLHHHHHYHLNLLHLPPEEDEMTSIEMLDQARDELNSEVQAPGRSKIVRGTMANRYN